MKATFTRASGELPRFSWLASGFAVLAGATVTNTGATSITGDLGIGDAVAAKAQSDLTAAYNDAAGRTPATSVSGDIGGQTLIPGVYKSASSLGITGTLTLNAQGNPNAVFIFQIGSTLITASGSKVDFTGGAQASNVFWQVRSSATLGTFSTLAGNILALASITVTTGVTIDGRALARNGAVTLDTDTITNLVPALTITKTASTSNTSPGSIVCYPITVAETGQTPYTGAALTDSLTGVLGNASYDHAAAATAGTVSFASPNLTWTGNLAIGGTATVSCTGFTTGGGSAAETIPASDARYLISGFTATSGSAAFASVPVTRLSAAAQAIVTATDVHGDNSAAWNPVVQVSMPSGAVAGAYSATITYSAA